MQDTKMERRLMRWGEWVLPSVFQILHVILIHFIDEALPGSSDNDLGYSGSTDYAKSGVLSVLNQD